MSAAPATASPTTLAHRRRELAVVAAVSGALILAQAVVFAAFGLMLLAMSGDMHWSAADSGAAYTLVVLGACIGAPLPVFTIRRIGAGRTIVAGQLLLAAAFAVLWSTTGLPQLYTGALLAGIAFSLCGNTPGVYLVSGWSGARAAGLIGIYMMLTMLGNAFGPPGAQALIAAEGWRGYALVVIALGVIGAALCAVCLREPPQAPPPGAAGSGAAGKGGLGPVLRSPVFALLALAIVTGQICIITVSSVAPAHLAGQGLSGAFAARLLGIEGVASALATGLLGHFARPLAPRRMLPLTLLCCAVGMAILATSRNTWALHAFALLIGVGVGGSTLAVTLLLVRYFGPVQGSASLGPVWTLAGLAAVGPWLSGLAADATGGYAPALLGFGAMMVPVALATLVLPAVPQDRDAV